MNLRLIFVLACGALPAQHPESAPRQPTTGDHTARDLTGYLPVDTPVVFDLHGGSGCLRSILDWLAPLPEGIPKAGQLFLMSLPVISKAQTGMDLVDLLEVLAPSQTAFAFFPVDATGEASTPPFPILLTRVVEPEEADRVMRRLAAKADLYYSIDASVLTVTTDRAHLATALAFRSRPRSTLLHDPDYRRGRMPMAPDRSIRFHIDLATIRGRYSTKSYWDNLDEGARLLIGPLVRVLDLASRIDGRLDIAKGGLSLHGRADADLAGDAKQVGDLLAAGRAARDIPPSPAGTLARLCLDRDIKSLLEEPDRWFGDDGALEVKSFLSVADQILGGSSLLADLLPNIEMPMTLFATASTPDEFADRPKIQLPAFTLVFRLGADQKVARRLLDRALQAITTVANVQRIRDKKVPIAVRSGRRDGHRFKQIRFGEWRGPDAPPTEQGLSPTLLFAHGHGIVSSTVDGATRMASALAAPHQSGVHGDLLTLRGGPIADLVEQNLGVLSMGRGPDEGATRREAESFFRSLASILRVLTFDGNVRQTAGTTRFELELRRQR